LVEPLIRGGIYLARLDPAMGAEIGKLRPVAVLSAAEILDVNAPLVFVCPLSSKSEPRYASLHVPLLPRGDLKKARSCTATTWHPRSRPVSGERFTSDPARLTTARNAVTARLKDMKNVPTGDTPPGDRTDWPRVRTMRDADIHHDADSPRTTEADWDGAVLKQGGVEVGRIGRRGPNKRPTKEQVAIRLSPDVLAAFRAGGPGWQTRINEVLQDWIKRHPSP
jgi:uncharacterized protein (DUF4415 family)/mRNA-degrading endonuclease toxin of MazEF toxin-antitoxin module